MSVCLVDTTILCELLAVPNMHRQHAETLQLLQKKIQAQEHLLLPLTTILETGNHIGQNGDGNQRRQTAQKFAALVRAAIHGQSPFALATPFFTREQLDPWLDQFPDYVMRGDARRKGSGFGDFTIVQLYEEQCRLSPARRVYIWSHDQQLAHHDRAPRF